MYTENEVQEIFRKLRKQFHKEVSEFDKKKVCKTLSFSNSYHALGTCHKKQDMFYISISKHSLKNKQSIQNTLAHELIHTIPGCFNHGHKFKKIAAQCSKQFGFDITTRADREECCQSGMQEAKQQAAKYRIVCEQCGHITYRLRASNLTKHPELYFCRCGGNLRCETLTK